MLNGCEKLERARARLNHTISLAWLRLITRRQEKLWDKFLSCGTKTAASQPLATPAVFGSWRLFKSLTREIERKLFASSPAGGPVEVARVLTANAARPNTRCGPAARTRPSLMPLVFLCKEEEEDILEMPFRARLLFPQGLRMSSCAAMRWMHRCGGAAPAS